MREILTEKDILKTGKIVTNDEYGLIRTLAVEIAKKSKSKSASTETLLCVVFYIRKKYFGQLDAEETNKRISVETFSEIFKFTY